METIFIVTTWGAASGIEWVQARDATKAQDRSPPPHKESSYLKYI